MTDFSKPLASDAYATLLPALVTELQDLARGLDPVATGSHTNIPTNTIRWNAANTYWEKYNGTSWAALAATYAINISGNAATATSATSALTATTAGNISGIAAVANGGSGAATLAANSVLLGNGTSALQTVAPSTSGNVLTSNGTTWQSSAAPVTVPTGAIAMWPTATAPSGWLLANGAAVSRTTYATLFAIVGTVFGVGDGSTTFNLPNYTDRMPIGSGNSYLTAATGGSADSIVVSHTHTFTGNALPTHTHGSGVASGGGGSGFPVAYGSEVNQLSTSAVSAGTPSGTNSTTGSTGVGANLPPYLGIRFIIKT
jgi:microcystin-dependent protein